MNRIARLGIPRTCHPHRARSGHNGIHRAALPYRSLSSKPPEDALVTPLESSTPTTPPADPFDLSLENLDTGFPNLMTPHPLMDTHDVAIFRPSRKSPYRNKVVVRNEPPLFLEQDRDKTSSRSASENKSEDEVESLSHLPLNSYQMKSLLKFPILTRRITQQTGKGKIHRMYTMMVVGNGDGLVGYGEGKDDEAARAAEKAFAQAVRNMDWVERFEKRTIWTEMDTKLGATRVILRPRPVGFGLRCNPNIHQVLKAAGIKDISAKVWGSRNPLNVIKALFRMLQAGSAPLAMGDGIGGGGRKLNKGSGLRSKNEVERERGRKLIDLRY